MTAHPNCTNGNRVRARVGALSVSVPVSTRTNGTSDRSNRETACAHALGREPGVDRVRLDTRGIVPEEEAQFLAEGFGAYLRALRKDAGLSQDRASALSGLSVSHISKLERGLRRPSIPAVKALARVLSPVGEREAMEQRLAGLAGESLRDGADRKKLQAENKNRRQALRDMVASTAKIRANIRRKEAAGYAVSGTERRFLEMGERMVEKLGATPEKQPQTIPGFEPQPTRRPRKFTGRPTLRNLEKFLDDNE